MENNNRDAGELLPGLKKGVKHLARLRMHSGGVYAERDAGRREGIQNAEQHLQMLINQIKGE